jgi:hypothetical protein
MVGSPKKRALPPLGQRIMSLAQLDKARLEGDPHFAPYIPMAPAIVARKGGRPTAYRPEFCEAVLDDALLGHSLGATAALIGVARSTLLDWAARHPEFSDAVALAQGIRQRFYEGHLIDIARRGGDSTRMSAIKLGLFNVGGQDWKDRITADHNVTFGLGDLIKQSMQLEGKLIEGERSKPADADDGVTLE